MYTGFSYKYTNEYDTLYKLHPYQTNDFKDPPFELLTEIASTLKDCLRVCITKQEDKKEDNYHTSHLHSQVS